MVDSLENPSTTSPITKNMLRQKIQKSQKFLHFSDYKEQTWNVDNDLSIRSVPKIRHGSISFRNRAAEVKNEADTHQTSRFEIQKIQTSPESALQRCKKACFRCLPRLPVDFRGFLHDFQDLDFRSRKTGFCFFSTRAIDSEHGKRGVCKFIAPRMHEGWLSEKCLILKLSNLWHGTLE